MAKKKRRRYTDVEKAAAVDAFVNGGKTLDEAAALVGCVKTTVRDWLLDAGVDPGEVAVARERSRQQTEDATATRLAKAAANRADLLDLLRSRITLPAARLIADRLDRAEADEALIVAAREKWRDCLVAEAMADQFGAQAVKDAKSATVRAKVDVMVAEAGTPDVNELSMILNRGVRDLLAIEGYDAERADEDTDGRITVLLTAPRPNRGTTRVVQLGAS